MLKIKIPMKLLSTVALLSYTLLGCKDIQRGPLLAGEKPGMVTDVRVENQPGAADIFYAVPPTGTLYVMAEYETSPGVKRQAKSSIFKRGLRVEGFPAAGEYEVTIYSVGAGEQRSEPLTVSVNPDTPPAVLAFGTLALSNDFGGMRVQLDNEAEGDLAIGVITLDSAGQWVNTGFHYSKMKTISFAIRGFDPEETQFGVFIRDRWENLTDTLLATLTPLFEEEIDRSTFVEVQLPSDTWQGHSGGTLKIANMFNDVHTSTSNVFHTAPLTGIPQHFTFDMNKLVKLSRFRLWPRPTDNYIFNVGNPRKLEVYGSTNPASDGSWDSWTLLGEYESVKPSGLPLGQLTAEDRAAAIAGEEFLVDINAPPVRYLRFKITQTWGGMDYISIAKLMFWGDIQN